jgi:S1-C subfamily serine protease
MILNQSMENESLRRHYNLSHDATGVLILSLAPLAPSSKLLRRGDVLLSIDDIPVANDGTIPFREGSYRERVFMNYYFTQRFAADSVRLRLLREGRELTVACPLYVPSPVIPRMLTQGEGTGGTPSYYIVGGLVFVTLRLIC